MEEPKKRPFVAHGITTEIPLSCGNFYFTINDFGDGPMEVFCHKGRSGSCAGCLLEGLGRMTSLALRSGIPVEKVAKQLTNMRCSEVTFTEAGTFFSCADAIGKLLKEYKKKEVEKNDKVMV